MKKQEKIYEETYEEPRDARYIYANKLDKACFQHDMAYGDLPR